ncbi:MAG: c-type cytochrome [Deltaproteobacteria bacterium]|nr:c-type cytochrome [Deltaproteobacteria bacterium]
MRTRVGAKWVALLGLVVVGCQGGRGTEVELQRGRQLYTAQCAGCHGAKADGQGELASYLTPRPRDLTNGILKYRTTEGTTPSPVEILQTVKVGVPGTAMPGWDLLSDKDWRALVAYLQHLIPRYVAARPGPRIEIPTKLATSPAVVSAGEQLFARSGCVACHGKDGQGNGPSAVGLTDTWGNAVVPRDLTRGPLKWGSRDEEIYRTLAVGIPGTPMPGYARSLNATELWQLVHYIQSRLQLPEGFDPSHPKRSLLRVARVSGELPLDPTAAAWQGVKAVPVYLHHVTAGQESTEWVLVKAIGNAQEIAFAVRWADDAMNPEVGNGDGVALQFPVRAPADPAALPFVAMGSADNPVQIWAWRAPEQITEWRAKGVGHQSMIEATERQLQATGKYLQGEWEVVLRHPLQGVVAQDAVLERTGYVAFAVWDADRPDRNQPKSFSDWVVYEYVP